MKKLHINLFSYLIVTLTLTSCFHDSTSTTPVPIGISGAESDRITGSGIEHIIHISVDGLQASAITALGITKLPGFYKIRQSGSFTDNARTDGDLSYTLPNHTSQLTSRPALGENGHNWVSPEDISIIGITLHKSKGSYVAGVFDVVHDFGLSTALYTSKTKFNLFKNSWDEDSGAIDSVRPDSGRNKIDSFVVNLDTEKLIDLFIADLSANKYNYAFLHLKDPDSEGHKSNWSLLENSKYLESVERIDSMLVKILDFIDTDPAFSDSTVLILTADHGGEPGTPLHILSRDDGLLDSSIIPFYVYGRLIPAAEDIYSWNPNTTIDPGNSIPFNDDVFQPVRNGNAANLGLQLLGLPPVPGSTMNNMNFPYF